MAAVAPNGDSDPQQRVKEQRQKLAAHFKTLSPGEHSHAWDHFWRENITPWDRNEPQPALVEALQTRPELFGSAFKDSDKKQRRTVLVPGCGRGYDVSLFASYGFNAVGLDISPTSTEEARKTQNDIDLDSRYPVRDASAGRGEARFITGDFFGQNYLSETHGTTADNRTFDLIYDYTFLCAIPPELRPKWAAQMSALLSPSGRLICMEYPLGKDPKSGGPPHGLESKVYEQLFAKPGQEIKYDSDRRLVEESSDEKAENALVRVEHWIPEKTFQEQSGQIKVSMWRHSTS